MYKIDMEVCMSQKITEILYNVVLSSGKAKEIASTLSLNYATFMREINIYDTQAKLSLKTFVHVVELLQEPALIYAIADMFDLDIVVLNQRVYSTQDVNSAIESLLQSLFIKIKEFPHKELFTKRLRKSYVRLLKEVNIYDPSAKLGIETFIAIADILNDVDSIIELLNITGFSVKEKTSVLT